MFANSNYDIGFIFELLLNNQKEKEKDKDYCILTQLIAKTRNEIKQSTI